MPMPVNTSQLDPHQQRVIGQLQDAVIALGPYQHRLSGLLQGLAPPSLPTDVLPCGGLTLTRQAIGRGPYQQQQGQRHMHPHGALVLLGWMAQVPRLLGDLDIAVPDQATVIVVIKGLQGLFDWSVCQPDGFAPRAPSPAHPTGARPPHGADWPGGPDGCAGAQARASPTGHRSSAPSCPRPQAPAVESRRLGLAHAGPYASGHRRLPPCALWRAPHRSARGGRATTDRCHPKHLDQR